MLPWPGPNEYDSEAVIATIHPEPLEKPDSPEMYRHHFRLLRDGLGAWMQGRTAPAGMPSYIDFLAGVTTALDHVRDKHHGARVLVVSSGGPISTAVGHVLGTAAETTIELNLRHSQHLGHRIRVHAQAPHAGDLQHAAAPRRAGLRRLGHLRLRGRRSANSAQACHTP